MATTDMVVRDAGGIQLKNNSELQFGTVGDILAYTGLIQKAGMTPKGMDSTQCAVAILAGAQLGLNPFSAMQNIAVINGRPAIWGDAMTALVQGSGLLEDYKVEYYPNQKDCQAVRVTVKRKGVETPITGEFSVAMAKLAGLWGKAGPWTNYPVRMMVNRARAFAFRDAFADVLKGIGCAEELQDVPDERPPVVVSGTSESPLTEHRTQVSDMLLGKKEVKQRRAKAKKHDGAAATPQLVKASDGEWVEAEAETVPPPVEPGEVSDDELIGSPSSDADKELEELF